MRAAVGGGVLLLSGLGYPLTQLAISRLGREGAVISQVVCTGLAVRDAAMIAGGVHRRLRRGPAALLWLELLAAVSAAFLSLRLLHAGDAAATASQWRPGGWEAGRRGAVGLLFGLHTVRFRIYLQPDRGRRADP